MNGAYLKDLKRNQKVQARLAGHMVRIYSGEHAAYWRPGGCGYTDDKQQAWELPFAEALAATQHCDNSKAIFYEVAAPEYHL